MKILAIFMVDSFGCSTLTNMIGRYFFLAFVCVSLGQALGDELENAIFKGLSKANCLFERGTRRIENLGKYQNEIIGNKAIKFCQNVERLVENSKIALSRASQTAEEKAKETDKPSSVFECIIKAEKNSNNQIEISAKKFSPVMEKLQKVYSKKVELVSTTVPEMKQEFKTKYEDIRSEIKAAKNSRSVELTFNNFSIYADKFFEDVGYAENQINCVLRNFEREVKSVFNNTNRQISATQSAGLRQIKACVYRRDQF